MTLNILELKIVIGWYKLDKTSGCTGS